MVYGLPSPVHSSGTKASSDASDARHGQDDRKGLAHFPDPCLACNLPALACMGRAIQPIKRLGGRQTRQTHCQAFLGSLLKAWDPLPASFQRLSLQNPLLDRNCPQDLLHFLNGVTRGHHPSIFPALQPCSRWAKSLEPSPARLSPGTHLSSAPQPWAVSRPAAVFSNLNHSVTPSPTPTMNAPPRHLPPPIAIAQQAGRLAPLSFLGSPDHRTRVQHPPPPPPAPILRSPGHDRLVVGNHAHSTASPPTRHNASLHHHSASYHGHAPPPMQSPHDMRDYSDERRDYHDDRREFHDETESFTGDGPAKKKQKRNKPTLSCHECVERKTKRQTECRYAHVANLLEETTRSASTGRRMTKAPKKKPGNEGRGNIPNIADRYAANGDGPSRGALALSTGLMSNVPYSKSSSSNVFGIGSEHPFANYWTCEGGLMEVISVLPEKQQADILINRYFECVDPVYPMIHRLTFYADYEEFWRMSGKQKQEMDAAYIAQIFVMIALGTQFVTSTTPKERKQQAEFFASASNQALRMSSYLSIASLRSIQAMVLMTYFLINDNHASDGWAFAGILIRQAYAMGLHRDPNIVTPDASPFEKQQRRKVWQAVLLQDTFLTVLLSLPPSATHTDVSVDDLNDHGSSIASSDPTDTAYIRGSWTLANLVQETICSPRSLDLPICSTGRHKSKLVADFRAVYRSFPDVFRSWDADSLTGMAQTNKRVVRQTLFLTSNYFHNLMLVHASESPDVPVNIRGTLEAAHDAIGAFFMLFSLLEAEARVWWVFNHRAFLEAVCIGNVLREALREPGGKETLARDPLFVRAKADITRMIEILQLMIDDSEVAHTRIEVLSSYLTLE
ncbi:Zn(II)2Cys6 transcription factor [Cordyceps militaris]|uniref:Zn(II)2Cys6 transcription factor n=1 Tax=Cordyceps militaris TaxID=73501 RepID=A0A2H4SCD7_CORMI|nr:Zn(II)2Cys6 transcription factor [Cordyceps militaris]